MNLDGVAKWLGYLILAGYAALTVEQLVRYFASALAVPGVDAPGIPRSAVSRRRLWAEVLIAFALSRLLALLVCVVACGVENGTLAGFWPALWDRLFPWDAWHYIDIIRDGYVTTGDARLFIVFFPFYPMVCRCITFMTGLPAEGVALAVSNAALVGCGGAMWRLAEPDGGPEKARRAMLLWMFCPMTYFCSIAYSESVFLLVTLLAVLFARRRRFALAVLFGAMASGARLLGMATAIPIFWELLRAEADRQDAPLKGGALARAMAVSVARVLPVSLGFVCYLCLNWRLFGNPTQFMVFQSQHWYQNLGDIGNTFRYCLVNAVDYEDGLYRLGVWIPQALLLVAVPLLILWRRKREKPGDVAYALAYHYVAFSPTWLLSGPRYAACNYALYPMLAGIPRGKRGFMALLAGECTLMAGMTWLGLWLGKVY